MRQCPYHQSRCDNMARCAARERQEMQAARQRLNAEREEQELVEVWGPIDAIIRASNGRLSIKQAQSVLRHQQCKVA